MKESFPKYENIFGNILTYCFKEINELQAEQAHGNTHLTTTIKLLNKRH